MDMEKSMPRKSSCWLGLCVAAALFAPAGASAATLPIETAKPALAHAASVIDKTGYRRHHDHHHRHRWHHRGWHHHHHYRPGGYGRCSAWRHECASRWGWGGHGYGRCLWRHGC
jgi:hypothetical protein